MEFKNLYSHGYVQIWATHSYYTMKYCVYYVLIHQKDYSTNQYTKIFNSLRSLWDLNDGNVQLVKSIIIIFATVPFKAPAYNLIWILIWFFYACNISLARIELLACGNKWNRNRIPNVSNFQLVVFSHYIETVADLVCSSRNNAHLTVIIATIIWHPF